MNRIAKGADVNAPPGAVQSVAGAEPTFSAADRRLPTLCWSAAATVLLFLGFTHLGVMLSFGVGAAVPALLAPAALLLASVAGDWLARREGLCGRWRIAPPAVALATVALSLFLASCFFDLSWDGQWYHQTAVYQMAHGWNPLRDPMHAFSLDLQDWVRHYAKGPWYVALALFETTGSIEVAKAATWTALAAMFLAVLAAALDFGLLRGSAVLIAMLVSLNPVVVCELASYLVDGQMAAFLTCFVAALFCWIRRSGPLLLVVALASAVLCINAKLTGLVYVCFFASAGGAYVLLRRRDLLVRYVLLQVSALLLGTIVLGYNPYVTNTVHRGNPFYPWSGSAAYPGFSDPANDPNERYETPHNLLSRNRAYRLGFAIFGRPGAQPVTGGEDARLMWPFSVRADDLARYRIHGLRIAGFGPLFSGAFLLCLGLLGAALLRPGSARWIALLFAGTIVSSLLISPHTWWARYAPQLWWLPIVAVVAGLCTAQRRAIRGVTMGLAALLLVNAALVAFVHFRWEIEASRTLRRQLADLRQRGEVAVDFQYFREPWSERLRAAGVAFRAVQHLPCDQPQELVSVAPGYPGAVRVCVLQPPLK
jgi:hypothetical protein